MKRSRRRFIHVFAGMDALSVAKPDWDAIAFSEIEPFACAVLAHHHPDVPNLGDITKVDFTQFAGSADIWAGGSPCQAFSIAGLRKSLQDARGNLTLEYIRGFNESQCPIGLWENVPGVLTTDDNAFGLFIAGMVGESSMLFPDDKQAEKWLEAEFVNTLLCFNLALVDFRLFRTYRGRHPKIKWGNAGMVFGTKGSFAWRVLDAQYFSLPQRRERVFGVAFRPGNAHRLLGAAPTEDLTRFLGLPGAVLFEPGSLPGYTAPRRQARQKVTSASQRCTGGDSGSQLRRSSTSGGLGGSACGCDRRGGDNSDRLGGDTGRSAVVFGGGNRQSLNVATTLCSHNQRNDCESESIVYESIGYNPVDVSPTLDARCKDGPIRNQQAPFVACFQQNTRDEVRLINGDGQLAGAVVAEPGMKQQNYLAFSYKDYGDDAGAISPTLRSGGFKASHANSGAPPAICYHLTFCDANGRRKDRVNDGLYVNETDKSNALTAGDPGYATVVKTASNILRRFSPTECLRLQGFPDGYLNITYRGKPAFNGPKYRAIGNSWAVTVARWVGDRVDYV
ncbi:MAG TPA: DNA cytosine methyltransferase, partial [Cyanophyceae cyanobacterium]